MGVIVGSWWRAHGRKSDKKLDMCRFSYSVESPCGLWWVLASLPPKFNLRFTCSLACSLTRMYRHGNQLLLGTSACTAGAVCHTYQVCCTDGKVHVAECGHYRVWTKGTTRVRVRAGHAICAWMRLRGWCMRQCHVALECTMHLSTHVRTGTHRAWYSSTSTCVAAALV